MSVAPPDYRDPRVQDAMKRVYEAVRIGVKEGRGAVQIGCAASNALGVFVCRLSGAIYLAEESVIRGDKRICPFCGEERELT